MRRLIRRYSVLIVVESIFLLLFSSCTFPGMVTTNKQLPRVSYTSKSQSLPPIHFPQDEGAHGYLSEWWYYTGHLVAIDSAGKQHPYGFELVIFQGLRSDYQPVYASHFAISDITRGQFRYDQRTAVEQIPIPNGSSTNGINVHVGYWSIHGINGEDNLVAQMSDYAINLHLTGTKRATLHNGTGVISYGLGGFSYYYSRTRMEVGGLIMDHGLSMHVTGIAWMDHQWGNFLPQSGGGWDWYSLQLSDQSEIMLYFIRDQNGDIVSTYASLIDSGGNDVMVPTNALTLNVLGHWTSSQTHITYPSGWQLTVQVPQGKTVLAIIPQLKDQELVVYKSTGNVYWEGAVSVEGQRNGNTIHGDGYVELTGYVQAATK